jgi:hypothetical protein
MIAKTHSVSARVCASLLAGMFVTWLGLLPAPAAAQTLSGLFSQPDAADKQELDAAGKKSGLTPSARAILRFARRPTVRPRDRKSRLRARSIRRRHANAQS